MADPKMTSPYRTPPAEPEPAAPPPETPMYEIAKACREAFNEAHRIAWTRTPRMPR